MFETDERLRRTGYGILVICLLMVSFTVNNILVSQCSNTSETLQTCLDVRRHQEGPLPTWMPSANLLLKKTFSQWRFNNWRQGTTRKELHWTNKYDEIYKTICFFSTCNSQTSQITARWHLGWIYISYDILNICRCKLMYVYCYKISLYHHSYSNLFIT